MTLTRLASLAILALLALPAAAAGDDFADVRKEIAKRHDESVQRLRDWIAAPAIAAEDRGFPDGAEPSTSWRADVIPASATMRRAGIQEGLGPRVRGDDNYGAAGSTISCLMVLTGTEP